MIFFFFLLDINKMLSQNFQIEIKNLVACYRNEIWIAIESCNEVLVNLYPTSILKCIKIAVISGII